VTVPTSEELLEVAVVAALAAGAIHLEGLDKPKQIEHKTARTSIVTWVDVAAQAEVVRVITERFPDHAILAEEDLEAGSAAAVRRRDAGERIVRAERVRSAAEAEEEAAFTWLVDPLDGTSNYAHGIPFACASVAVRDADGPVAGAIFEPFRRELFTASRGGGAWLGSERLSVSDTDSVARALVATGVQSDDPAAVAAFAERMVALMSRCRSVRCVGSPALCLAYVAAGRLDAFLERDGTYAWDVGAGGLMITEAGGRIEDLDGGPLNLGPGVADVLATNGHIHEALAELVRSARH
jgi:myo-inositol-1(or 4)-monophosphatase